MAEAATKLVDSKIPIGVGTPGSREMRQWYDAQVVYENWAGQREDLDAKVREFVYNLKASFKQRMMGHYNRWVINTLTANGDSVVSEYDDDVHVPECYKMLETIIPRMEEAMFEWDPWLEVEGTRSELDHLKAMAIGSYIRRRFELAKFRDYVAPTVRDSLLCQIAAIKVTWNQEMETVIETAIEQKVNANGQPYWHVRRESKKAPVREGPEFHQVDPGRLIIDLDAGQVKDLSFIGDESDQPIHKLRNNPAFNQDQVEMILGETRKYEKDDAADYGDFIKQARAAANFWSQTDDETSRKTDEPVRVTDLHTYFNFGDGDLGLRHPDGTLLKGSHKVVITMAGHVVLRFQLNPFDKKFFPYGVARLNRNGHEMLGVGPFDNAVVLNGQYDRFQSNILRHFDLSIAPIITTTNDTDLPKSLLGIRPGTIFRHVGELNQIKISDIPQSVSYMHDYYRREVEEITGAPRFWSGTSEPSGTLGEAERKLQESNRRLRGYIRSYADMWRQVALIVYWMSAQFSTNRERFRIIGKQSQYLGKYAELTPDMLQEEIDVRFIGLDNLHTYGQRGTGMLQWMNMWGPLLPNYADRQVNVVEVMERTWEHMVGKDARSSIFNVPTPESERMPQQQENLHLRRGLRVEVGKDDDDNAHLEAMEEDGILDLMRNPDTPLFVRQVILDHYETHVDQGVLKEEAQRNEQEEAMRNAMLLQGGPGQGQPAANGGVPVTPGPTQGRTVARTGRSGAGTSQSQQAESTEPQ